MNKKHYAFFNKKRRKKSNPIAKVLKFFTPQVIRDKTKYRRKEKHARKRSFWEST
jgi:hypothetical protein